MADGEDRAALPALVAKVLDATLDENAGRMHASNAQLIRRVPITRC